MLLAAEAALSALRAAAHGTLLAAITFMAPLLLPGMPSPGHTPTAQQRAELKCSVNFRAGTVRMAGDGAAGAAVDAMRAAVGTAAPSSSVMQPPAAGYASADCHQHWDVLIHLRTTAMSSPAGNAAALGSIGSAGNSGRGDGVSALPDEALYATQLDAALHLAAVDAVPAQGSLRVPAAAACFSFGSSAVKHGNMQHQLQAGSAVSRLRQAS